MSTTQAIIEWDDDGNVVKFNGVEVSKLWGERPIYELDKVLRCNCHYSPANPYNVTIGQRVLPERPDNVPADAQLGFVWVTPEVAHNYGEVYGLDGECCRYIEQGEAARIYGVTFPESEPEPEPTPESVLAARIEGPDNFRNPKAHELLAALTAAGFEIVRKADTPAKPAEVLCVNCDRPLRLNDDGSLWRASNGNCMHADKTPGGLVWCCDDSGFATIAVPAGVR